jgi:tRNA-modifying protein YgfZ
MDAVRIDRAFVRVAGPDAEAYLQGQLSQDVTTGTTGLAFLLEPTGKVNVLLRWQRTDDDAFLLDTDAEAADVFLERLRRFLLRTRAEVEPVELRCLRVFGERPDGGVPAPWPTVPDAPFDLVGTDAAESVTDLDQLGYHRKRILAGVPVCGVDVGSETIPAEVGAWAIEAAVSFTKGCYTGQELVARIDSRGGNVPRPLRVLQSADGGSMPQVADVLDDDGAVVGRVTSAAADVALGPIARRVGPGVTVRVGDGTPAVVLR